MGQDYAVENRTIHAVLQTNKGEIEIEMEGALLCKYSPVQYTARQLIKDIGLHSMNFVNTRLSIISPPFVNPLNLFVALQPYNPLVTSRHKPRRIRY
jgi:hypothetical protein